MNVDCNPAYVAMTFANPMTSCAGSQTLMDEKQKYRQDYRIQYIKQLLYYSLGDIHMNRLAGAITLIV